MRRKHGCESLLSLTVWVVDVAAYVVVGSDTGQLHRVIADKSPPSTFHNHAWPRQTLQTSVFLQIRNALYIKLGLEIVGLYCFN